MYKSVPNEENGRYQFVRDIMTVPASIRINGQKAITVKNGYAYAQRADGMTIYRYNEREDGWYVWKTIVAGNC